MAGLGVAVNVRAGVTVRSNPKTPLNGNAMTIIYHKEDGMNLTGILNIKIKGGIHLTQAPPICCGFAKLFFGNATRMITVGCMSYRPYFYSCHHIKQHSTCCGHLR
jgi:hypothetical protein